MSLSFDLSQEYGSYPITVSVSDISNDSASVRWYFGDGTETETTNNNPPPPHKYDNAGTYYFTAQEINGNGEVESKIVKEIKVFDKTISTIGIGHNLSERAILNYGNSTEQGYGWSDDGGDGCVWADTKFSVMSLFNGDGDSIEIAYCSRTGLPYVRNPRKAHDSTKIVDAWKDKVDPLIANTGTPIKTRVKLQELIGSHEAFQQKMSDISLFFSPIYKEKQGADGYNSDGLLDDMEINIELYKDDLLDKKASAQNIPMKTELYFDRAVFGNVLQLAFETTESEYRFTRAECFLSDYDKARSPFVERVNSSGDTFIGMTEKDYQSNLSDVSSLWISRGGLSNRVTNLAVDGIEVATGEGVDGKESSSFTCSSNVILPNIATKSLMVISDKQNNIFTNQSTEVLKEVSSGWYLHYANNGVLANLETVAGVKYFDLRLLAKNVTKNMMLYYINDVAQNSANSTCPRF